MLRSRRGSRASIVNVFTYSTIFEDEEGVGGEEKHRGVLLQPVDLDDSSLSSEKVPDNDYSVSEISESFTFVQTGKKLLSVLTGPGAAMAMGEEDTDVEEDDEFDEYSEVTFEQPKPVVADVRVRKNTVYGQMAPNQRKLTPMVPNMAPIVAKLGSTQKKNLENHNHGSSGGGLCHCAETYRNAREKRRRAVSTVVNMHQAKDVVQSTSDDTSLSSESGDELGKLGRVRKKSRFLAAKEVEKALVEGIWKLEANRNYEEYLAAIGTGPCSQDMVMRADVKLTIEQEVDKQWRISTETVIKAKSIRGYRTSNRKWTENKFKVGEGKPELLDDWDQRLVVTTLALEEDGSRLCLHQLAEKDQMHCKDTTVELDVDPEDPEVLVMTCLAGEVRAWRRFLKQKPPKSFANRKISAPF